jgi:predicted  nucleic acid-binding Zn-ribbon protein
MDMELREMLTDIISEQIKPVCQRLDKMDERLDGMDKRFETINERLDGMDKRFEKLEGTVSSIRAQQSRDSRKLSDLQLDVKVSERNIRRDIYHLNDEMDTVIEVLRQQGMIPR